MANGSFSMNHMEIYVRDMDAMCAYYTDVLGFKITDQGELGERRLVFLSRNPEVHHQFVFCTGRPDKVDFSVHNHVSFQLGELATLREVWQRVCEKPHAKVEEITHGNAWSIYFRDPEHNRVECFVETPWYTPQPCREPIDRSLPDDELRAWTEDFCRNRPGFQTRDDFFAALAERMAR